MKLITLKSLIFTFILISNIQADSSSEYCYDKISDTKSESIIELGNVFPLNSFNRIMFLAICPILLTLEIMIISLFFKYPSLLSKPGNLFFTLVLIETFLNLHLFSSAIYHTIFLNKELPTETYPYFCQITGSLSTFLEINHFCYLFLFLFYTIFLFRFSLKKKSKKFWSILHIFLLITAALITSLLYLSDFIGPNLYGLCGLTTLLSKSKKVNWKLFIPSFGMLLSITFFFLGIYTSIYYKKHMPSEGQLKNRKIKNSKIIFLFVTGFSFFEFFTCTLGLLISIFCKSSKYFSPSLYESLIYLGNSFRVLEYCFTILLILWNSRFRRKFKMLIKNIFIFKSKNHRKASSFISDDGRNKEIEMEEVMFDEKLLHLKDRSDEIDLLFVCQIFTIVSGVYVFFYEYLHNHFTTNQENINNKINTIKSINFKESITLEIDHNSMKNYEFETRLMLKLKILKCILTLHSPKVFFQLLTLDGLEAVHESFKILENMKKIWGVATDGQGGKSGEFFFFSTDRKYVLKTITPEEFEFLKNNLNNFYDHYSKNPDSLLAKIYGLFTIKGDEIQRTYRLILMKNITGCKQTQISRVYDLKGSKYDRQVDKEEMEPNELEKITLKDIDFMKKEGKIKIEHELAIALVNSLQKDAAFLKELNLIDYSLLVIKVKWDEPPKNEKFWGKLQRIPSIENKNEFYHIGVIDYLQLWDFQKKSEAWWKKLLGKKDISSINPKDYCLRFSNFVEEICLDFNESYNKLLKNNQNNQKEFLERKSSFSESSSPSSQSYSTNKSQTIEFRSHSNSSSNSQAFAL